MKVGFENSQRGVETGSLGDSHVRRGLGVSSLGHPTVGEVLVELGNDIIAVGKVTVAASTPSLAFSCELALQAEFITRRILGGNIVSRTHPVSLEVSNVLVAFGKSSFPASQETTVGVGVLPLILGDGEHATATSSSSATTDARDFDDRPQLHNLSLDDLHPLVGDPWEAIVGLGLHGFAEATCQCRHLC